MTVSNASVLHLFVGAPLTFGLFWLIWKLGGGLWSFSALFAWGVVGLVFLRCPRCRNPAFLKKTSGPLADDFPLVQTFATNHCPNCGLDYRTAKLNQEYNSRDEFGLPIDPKND